MILLKLILVALSANFKITFANFSIKNKTIKN